MVYEIEQYQLYSQKYRVEADCEAEAIHQLYKGVAEQVGDPQYLMVVEEFGLPSEEYDDLVDDLDEWGESVDDVIPSVRSIKVIQ